MGGSSRSGGGEGPQRRRYDTPVRRQKAAGTRERIVGAGSELVHEFASWDWKGLTFRAVAERAGVGERTVYRHFPTERHLHDAVMQRLEEEAGVTYDNVHLPNLGDVTARVFASRRSFAAEQSVEKLGDPTFVAEDTRRRDALCRAVAEAAPAWSEPERRTVAALLDVLWNLPSYERLVDVWNLSSDDATGAITWLIGRVVQAVRDGERPPMQVPVRRRDQG
jgi:AcrR family transcriptional regulator